MDKFDLLQLYHHLGLIPIPLKSRSRKVLIKRRNGWNASRDQSERWATYHAMNWGERYGDNLEALDFDCKEYIISSEVTT